MTAPERGIVNMLVLEMERVSNDPDTQVGCVITDQLGHILVMGANHSTAGIKLTGDRAQRPEKYNWIEHAERNAIFNAARRGIPLAGSVMHLPGFPCVECARGIAQSGIVTLYCGSTEGWDESRYKFSKSREILKAAGVVIFEREL